MMPAISFPVNALFLASRRLPSCSTLTLHLPCTNEERKRAHTPSGVSSYKDTHPVGPTLITTLDSNYILTPNTATYGLGPQHTNSGGGTIQSVTPFTSGYTPK